MLSSTALLFSEGNMHLGKPVDLPEFLTFLRESKPLLEHKCDA